MDLFAYNYFYTDKLPDRQTTLVSLSCSQTDDFSGKMNHLWYNSIKPSLSLRRRANARNVSFRISLRWITYIVNSVDKTKLSSYLTQPHSIIANILLCSSQNKITMDYDGNICGEKERGGNRRREG